MGLIDKIPYMVPGATLRNIFLGVVYGIFGVVAVIFAIGVLAVLLLGGGGDGGANGGQQAAAPTGTPTPESAPTHGMNESFVVGSGAKQVRYTVTDVRTQGAVGGLYGSEEAAGEFVIVRIQIENVGDESFQLSSNVFHLVDEQERTYDTDPDAMVYLDNSMSYEQVNPGLTIEGVVVFDVPPDQQERWLRVDPAGIFSGAESHYVVLRV